MLHVLRLTLMWLIAVAVPIQGSAAVAMFGCGPGHLSGTGASQAAMLHDHELDAGDHSHAAIVQGAGTDHHGGGAFLDRSDSLEAYGALHEAPEGNCSPCASCCVVAALPATLTQFEPVPPVDFFVPMAQIGASSFLADGLERPPRRFLV